MKTFRPKFKKRYEGVIFLGILCLVVFLTVGYSTYSAELGIDAFRALVRVQKDIRVDGISVNALSGNATSTSEEYNVHNVSANVSMPSLTSSITYDVVIRNVGNVEMGIYQITGLPSNLKYSIDNYDLKSTLCDDNNSIQCTLGTTTTLHLKIEYDENGYDASNTDYLLNLDFDFKRVFTITYSGIEIHNYPQTMMEDETLGITFIDDVPDALGASPDINPPRYWAYLKMLI